MTEEEKRATEAAYDIWKRGFLLDHEAVTFSTEHGKVSFKHDGERLICKVLPKAIDSTEIAQGTK